ncbi:MAG: hypothetical protein ACPG7Q_02020 [Candidatus Poseidoniaceae archaeon]
MVGRVSKAKRPKRRWIGLSVSSTIQSRSELADMFASPPFSAFGLKVYDFHMAESSEAKQFHAQHECRDDAGVAIVRVLLSDYEDVRALLQSGKQDIVASITSSGKIRLVRERLGLPKPSRR